MMFYGFLNNMWLNITYLIVFFGMSVVSFKIINDSNFEKAFKKGKTPSIIIASILLSLILGYLSAELLTSVLSVILQLIKK